MPAINDDSMSRILAEFAAGDRAAIGELLPRVYDELRRLAAVHLKDERAAHTLQPTALVHEAFIRLSGSSQGQIEGRSHFFRLASKLMRQILVDHARARDAAKRGGGQQPMPGSSDGKTRISVLEGLQPGASSQVDLLALDEALERLEALDPRKSRLVELRFFGGLTEDQAADVLGISRTQAAREWRTARAWLSDELRDAESA